MDLLLAMVTVVLLTSASGLNLPQRNENTVIDSVHDDLDSSFFGKIAPERFSVHIWHAHGERLLITADNPVKALIIMEAFNLHELVLHPNGNMRNLIIRACPLETLTDSIHNLHSLEILKIERCHINGTFDLAMVLPLYNLTKFSLEGNRITEVVYQHNLTLEKTSPLTVLNFENNLIEYFNLDVLSQFPMLQTLQMYRNRLNALEGHVSLPALVIVDFNSNHLTKFDFTGCNCSSLRQVGCKNNRLEVFPSFSDSSTSIRTLDLTQNALTAVNFQEIAKLRDLATLILSKNALTSLNNDDGREVELLRLTNLELDGNRLASLDLLGWVLPALTMLNADGNPLVSLPDNMFERYPKLWNIRCYCSDIDCVWVERNIQYIQNSKVKLEYVFESFNSKNETLEQCIPVPEVGCVKCVLY